MLPSFFKGGKYPFCLGASVRVIVTRGAGASGCLEHGEGPLPTRVVVLLQGAVGDRRGARRGFLLEATPCTKTSWPLPAPLPPQPPSDWRVLSATSAPPTAAGHKKGGACLTRGDLWNERVTAEPLSRSPPAFNWFRLPSASGVD